MTSQFLDLRERYNDALLSDRHADSQNVGITGGIGMYSKWLLFCCTAVLIAVSGVVEAGTLDRLRQDNTIRIAYRWDAPPFSYQNGEEKPTGFIVDLCHAVVKRLSQQANIPSLNVSFVPVTVANRFDVISQGNSARS